MALGNMISTLATIVIFCLKPGVNAKASPNNVAESPAVPPLTG
jgi:hypothetical protein